MKKILLLAGILLLVISGCARPEDGIHTLTVVTTNDVHGSWFNENYVNGRTKSSLVAINSYVDSIRSSVGAENFLLIDAGDCLQGDNASYYFNYIDTVSAHLFPRIAAYMGYDVITVGNHDIETGHSVYDRITNDLEREGIAFLGGNVIDVRTGKPYFQPYTILEKSGLKVAVLGYTNANIKAWLNESLWAGLDFKSLVPLVQQDVNEVIKKERPHIVIVSVHSGTGEGDGSIPESQAMDLYNSLEGVDLLIGSHDHRPYSVSDGRISYVNAGNAARNFGLCTINVTVEGGKVSAKSSTGSIVKADPTHTDEQMSEHFKDDFEAVKKFTLKEVGELMNDIRTSDAFTGMCDYLNLLHTVSLECSPAQISIAAPLTMNQTIKAGKLIYDDMFTLYRYENQLFVVRMSGQEVKDFLEYSYNMWIQTVEKPGDHVLRISRKSDARFNTSGWSFDEASYNFDSAAGIDYTVDVTRDFGSRVNISALADGTPFCTDSTYNVAMTSYRASGGGATMTEGAGVDTSDIESRVVAKYPEIRELIYQFISEHKKIDSSVLYNENKMGHWKFIPEEIAAPALASDAELMFGK